MDTRIVLLAALRQTVARLEAGAPYQWGHFGACNCGHLAQSLTRRPQEEIHRAALERATGWGAPVIDDWGDVVVEHCPHSGLPLDAIVDEMLAAGLSLQQIRDLEYLADRRILERLPPGRSHLRRNRREDLIAYLEAWAALLSEELKEAGCCDLAAE